jgi:endonuclease/exonuclease/phosphatase family metal-dependent hydrolase
MARFQFRPAILVFVLLIGFAFKSFSADSIRIVTYNVENYIETTTDTRTAKSAEAKAAVRESLRTLKPDVVALQEMGGTNALVELQGSLKSEGLDLPYWELVHGFDTNIQVAILSRFPFAARHPQTNDSFLLNGRRFRVTRGFAEVEIKVNDRYSFTLINAHLKSRLPIPAADEADLRLEEAKILREKIDALLAKNPRLNLIVLGDFNDFQNTEPIRTIVGRGNRGLTDLRPAERVAGAVAPRNGSRRIVTWTHHYAREDNFGRLDYMFISAGMARDMNPDETYVLAAPNWGAASDHRPLVATFVAEDK